MEHRAANQTETKNGAPDIAKGGSLVANNRAISWIGLQPKSGCCPFIYLEISITKKSDPPYLRKISVATPDTRFIKSSSSLPPKTIITPQFSTPMPQRAL